MKLLVKILILTIIVSFCHIELFSKKDNSVCLDCHNDPDISMEKNGRNVSLTVRKFTLARSTHAKLACVDCHAGFNPDDIPHKEPITPVNCTSCHKNYAEIHKFHPQMALSKGTGGSKDVNCKGCHGTHNILHTEDVNAPVHFVNSVNYCGKCHEKEKNAHLVSEHQFQYANNNRNVPTCINCHVNPITKENRLDPVQLKKNQEKLCLSCHLNNASQTKFSKKLINYDKSAHGLAISKGNSKAAGCIDCHGTHDLQKANKPNSRINQFNVPKLCGQCHKGITQEYMQSIHGVSLAEGNREAPGCSFCHGEHDIQAVPDVPHQVFTDNGMNFNTVKDNKMVFCISCHSNDKFIRRYKLTSVKVSHEWLPAIAKHWETVRCVDCHSSYKAPNLNHNILRKEETVRQCEQCHQKSSILMSKLYLHQKHQSRMKYGFINGTLLSDAYVIGTTRNKYLDTASVLLFIGTVMGVFGHAFLRFITRKRKK